ncbi:protein Bop [Phocoena sinus]|uniref:Retrotransposon Gag like 10 n=1 Tax=Phocoena sinus TaxID=42100 RepID=A0A8C9EE35_PHOSS|nr:protein Bop [Phocoena sinus]XP_032510417.1 protein Bop [Phocoena sinus]
MPRGRRQGPRNPIRAAANYANAHPWQEDGATPGVAYTPLVDPWIERPCCGDPVCVRTTMEQKSSASGAVGCKPAERGPPAMRMGLRPLRVDFHWVPGSDPGTFDGSPWLLDRFLAQLGDYMSFRFEHYRDNLSRVCEILGRLTGRARAWAAPYLNGDLPLPDNYELFCQDLEEVIQNPNNFAEYHAAGPCSLPLASSQPPVAPQLPVVRQYLARFSEALALNMGTPPRSVPAALATPTVSSSSSTSRNALSEQLLAMESSSGPVEPSALSNSAGSAGPGPVGPSSSQPGEAAPKPVLAVAESAEPPAQKPGPTNPGGPRPQKTKEEVSETEAGQEASLGTPQGAVDTPATPGEPPFCPTPQPTALDSEHGLGRYGSAPLS